MPVLATSGETSPASAQLAALTAELSSTALPEGASKAARACILDTVGVALAGWGDHTGRTAAQHALASYPGGDAQLIGGDVRVAPAGAAFANATLAHALDFDDTSWSFIGHASAILLPAALAAAESRGATGVELLRAFVAGFEVAARIGSPVVDTFAARGWHLTSTIGVFGAAAAAAVVLELDEAQTADALGLAASRAAGLKANFGTPAKPLHAGFAARDGVESAVLALAGAGGSHNAIESRFGFYGAFAGVDCDRLPPWPRELAIIADGVAVKRYPTCTGSHPAIDAVLALVAQHGIAADDVAEVRCGTTPEVPGELIHAMPTTADEARFSMAFPVAAALAYGCVDLDVVSDECVADPAIRRLMERCVMHVDPTLRRPLRERAPAAHVAIELKDGQVVSRRVDVAAGHPRRPLSESERSAKFRACAERRIRDRAQLQSLEDAIDELERIDDIRELGALMRGRS